MLNIIPTLTVMDTVNEYENMIDNYILSNSYVFRCNATRFDNETYKESIDILRRLYQKKTGHDFNLLLDIPCPKDKIRLEYLDKQNQLSVCKGQRFLITTNQQKMKEGVIFIPIDENEFSINSKIIIGDGDVVLEIICKNEYIECIASNSGEIGIGKACYIGNKYCDNISFSKFQRYIELISLLKPTYVALSFVEDENVKEYIDEILKIDKNIKIISKIESEKGIENIQDIIAISDGIMIGRGDLALASGYSKIPLNQEKIIHKCHEYKCSIYVATDIINSLRNNLFPSRAEVCDVYYLLKNGVENIVLSGPLCRYDQYNIATQLLNEIYGTI